MRVERRPDLVEALFPVPSPTARVVVVHPGAVSTAEYGALAAALPQGTDTHVINLEQVPEYFQAALSKDRPRTSVAALADRCAEALRELGPTTCPWTMVGWSFGGVVGHALTALLREEELPERLVLLDSIAAVDAYAPEGDMVDPDLVMPWFAMYLGAKRGATVELPGRNLPKDGEEAVDVVLRAAIEAGALHPQTSRPGLRKVLDAYTGGLLRNARLASDHDPAPSRVPLTLIRPARGLLDTPEPLGWASLDPDLCVKGSGGDHYTMLRDDAAIGHVAEAVSHTRPLRI